MTEPNPYYAPPPRPTSPPKTPWYRHLWVVALAALIIGVALGAGGASGSKQEAKPAPTVTATLTVTSTAPAPPAQTQTLKPTVIRTIATRTRTATVIYTPPPKPAITDGTYHVGQDIKPGEWRTNGNDDGSGMGCYWERDRSLSGSLDDTIANDNISGSAIVQLNSGEYFKVNGGCQWRRS